MEMKMSNNGRMLLKTALTLSAIIASGSITCVEAHADDEKSSGTVSGLINISTPEILPSHMWGAHADVRVFGGDEGTTYFNANIRYGLSKVWELGIGGSMAQFEKFNLPNGAGTIRHAGSDLELTAKYNTQVSGKYRLSGQFGVGLPNTPATKTSHFTAGIMGSMSVNSMLDLYINPRMVAISNNSITGLGFGAKVKLNSQFSVIGDYTAILSGANTIGTTLGNMRSHDIYGVGVRYQVNHNNMSIDLGYGNGTGFTTGSSLTPGLGDSGAFYIALNIKR